MMIQFMKEKQKREGDNNDYDNNDGNSNCNNEDVQIKDLKRNIKKWNSNSKGVDDEGNFASYDEDDPEEDFYYSRAAPIKTKRVLMAKL